MTIIAAAVALLTWLPPQDAQALDLTLWETETRTVTVQGHKEQHMWWSIVAIHFPESEIDTALRIIQCESLGDSGAINSRSGATGLFQIMPFWADHFGWPRDWLLDPSLNAEMARKVWDEQGWNGWSCY